METLKLKIIKLRNLLYNRNNTSYIFFDKILDMIDTNDEKYIDNIINSASIIQYANFNCQEEELFNKIWEIIYNENNNLHNK